MYILSECYKEAAPGEGKSLKAAEREQNKPVKKDEAVKENGEAAPAKEKSSNQSIKAMNLDQLLEMESGTRKANARTELDKRREHLTRQRTDGSKVSDTRAKEALKK